MASIEENYQVWQETYDWKDGGNEWSDAWGGVEMQWERWLYPRIKNFLPCKRMVEIGVGFGRWSEFLLKHCEILIGFDISSRCIEHCRNRFTGLPGATFYPCDGRSMPGLKPGTIDVIVSFDSLVHADLMTLNNYIRIFEEMLSPDGVAIIHHSNLKTYRNRLPQFALPRIEHFRARDVEAEDIRQACRACGLACFRQELMAWGDSGWNTDCISYIGRWTDSATEETEILSNMDLGRLQTKQVLDRR